MVDAKHELEVMAALSAALDDLTMMGPKVTARTLAWAFSRYGIAPTCAIKSVDVYDRRTSAPVVKPIIAPAPELKLPARLARSVTCPECSRNGFMDRRGLGGHMWSAHHIRMSEYAWPVHTQPEEQST